MVFSQALRVFSQQVSNWMCVIYVIRNLDWLAACELCHLGAWHVDYNLNQINPWYCLIRVAWSAYLPEVCWFKIIPEGFLMESFRLLTEWFLTIGQTRARTIVKFQKFNVTAFDWMNVSTKQCKCNHLLHVVLIFEPYHEKTYLWGLRPGTTQIDLLSWWDKLGSWIFGYSKYMYHTIQADLCLCCSHMA